MLAQEANEALPPRYCYCWRAELIMLTQEANKARVSTDLENLENLEKSGNFIGHLEKSGNSMSDTWNFGSNEIYQENTCLEKGKFVCIQK